jgi:type II secretory pathway pseudopilin PulG
MSFHELVAGYPWLTKRVARVMDTSAPMPRRNGFAYLLAMLVPFAGRLGAGFGMLIMVYIVGVMAAVAVPAYNDYVVKAKVAAAVAGSQQAREALGHYYESNQAVPESLEVAGVPAQLADGAALQLDPEAMVLTVTTERGEVVFTPMVNEQGLITWNCTNGEGIRATQLPGSCRSSE